MTGMYFRDGTVGACSHVYELRREARNDFEDFDLNIWV